MEGRRLANDSPMPTEEVGKRKVEQVKGDEEGNAGKKKQEKERLNASPVPVYRSMRRTLTHICRQQQAALHLDQVLLICPALGARIMEKEPLSLLSLHQTHDCFRSEAF